MRSSCFVEQVMLPGGTLLSHLEIPRWSFLDPWIHSPPDPQWCAFRIRAIMFFRPRPFSCVLTARTIIEVNTNSPSYRDSEPLEPQNLVWWTFYQYYGTRLKTLLLASASSKEHCTVHRIQIVSAASWTLRFVSWLSRMPQWESGWFLLIHVSKAYQVTKSILGNSNSSVSPLNVIFNSHSGQTYYTHQLSTVVKARRGNTPEKPYGECTGCPWKTPN